MTSQPNLEELYAEATQSLKAKDFDRASSLLRQILIIDENFKDTSRLLALTVKLRRRRWYSQPLLWGGLGLIVLVMLGIGFARRVQGFIASQLPTSTAMPTSTLTPTIAPTLAPTPIPLAWKRISTGQEFPRDDITAMVFDPKDPDIIYVGTRDAGIYKSINGGLSWQPAHKGLGVARVNSLVIDSQDPRTLYAGIALGGVFKTTDGGNNWYSFNYGINIKGQEQVSKIAISPGDSRRLYYLQGQNLYTSSDGGGSWTAIIAGGGTSAGCPRDMDSLAIDPANPSRLFILNMKGPGDETICKEGVYKSEDGGQSWTLALQFEPTGQWLWGWTSLAFDATGDNFYASNKQTVYRSSDHGETWQPLHRIEDCHVLSVDPTHGTRAFCASNDRIKFTPNGGANWLILREGLSYAQSISVSPHSDRGVFVGWDGLWATLDNGASWSTANDGLGAIHLDLSFDPLEPSALLVENEIATRDICRVYRSTDGAHNWDPAPERACSYQTAIDASGEWLFWIDSDDGSLWQSNNFDTTSQMIASPLEIEDDYVQIIASHPKIKNRLLAVYGFSLPYFFISDDLGATWHSATLLRRDNYQNPGPAPRMFFDHDQGQRIYLVSVSNVYRSDDAGESWQLKTCTDPKSDLGSSERKAGMIIWPENADHILLATRGNGILASNNGCVSWRSSNTGLGSLFVNTIAIDTNSPDTIYAGTDGGAYVSFDGGQTWNQINNGLLGATVVYSIVVDKDSNVYAATPYGIFRLEGK